MNTRGMAPVMATILLVAFSLVIGFAAMTWARGYESGAAQEKTFAESVYVISITDVDTPLKQLQIDYLTRRISIDEYTALEKEMLRPQP